MATYQVQRKRGAGFDHGSRVHEAENLRRLGDLGQLRQARLGARRSVRVLRDSGVAPQQRLERLMTEKNVIG